MVMNDMDSIRTVALYGTKPMGIEVQQTIFGFNTNGDLGRTIFKKYRIINKGNFTIREMALAMWSDPDIGSGDDDYVGCDTIRNIGFVYNGKAVDGVGAINEYGSAPPALCYDYLQGPVIPYDPLTYPIINEKHLPDSAKYDGKWIHGKTNLPMTSFVFYFKATNIYVDPELGSVQGGILMYNYMNGKTWDGDRFLDPTKTPAVPTNFCLNGDPVTGAGWYEGAGWPGGFAPGDRRMLISSGTFDFAPGDTQEVVFGIIIARGTSNINSVQELKSADDAVQKAFDQTYKITAVNQASPVIRKFQLKQNYPNPFNPATVISFQLPAGSQVSLKVYDALGTEVATLVNEYRNPGTHEVKFDAARLASGVYYYRLQAGAFVQANKMLLMK